MIRFAAVVFLVCVSAAAVATTLTPVGHDRVTLVGFSVAPPPGDGWVTADEASFRVQPMPKVQFGKKLGADSTAVAAAYAFAMPLTVKDPAGVLKLAMSKTQRGGQRTIVTSSTAELTTINGASCISGVSAADDIGVPGHAGDVFRLTKWSLICLHPQYSSFVVIMDYSERLAPGRQSPIQQAERDGFLQSLMFERLGRRITTIEVGGNLSAMAHSPGTIWAAYGAGPGNVARIDARTNTVVTRIPVGEHPTGLVAAQESLWVANKGSDNVMRIDPSNNKVVATIPVGEAPVSVIDGAGSIWVANSGDGTVSRIDASSNQAVTISGVGREPMGLAFAEGGVFVSDYAGDRIMRIDAATNAVGQIRPRVAKSSFLLADGNTLWVNGKEDAAVVQIALGPDAHILRRIGDVFGQPGRMLRAGGELWVTDLDRERIAIFDLAQADSRPRYIPAPEIPLNLHEGDGAIWASSFVEGAVLRLDPE